jgi:hypothetical protein
MDNELKAIVIRFLKKWDIVRPHIDNAVQIATIHHCPWNGPTIAAELDELKQAVGYSSEL